jgi:hypothetical protein
MIQQRLFNDSVRFVVRSGNGSITYDNPNPVRFTDEVCWANRVPVQNAGWQAVRYQNRWYQLFGGVHTPYFVCLNSPIRSATRG